MSERRGVLSAGTWCVDFNKSIARWPDEDTSNEVLAIDRQGGGSGFNMALDLKRLDPELPVEAMGVVGDDDFGRFLFAECDARGVDRAALRGRPGGATMSVDAFNVASNGRRTHFYHQGVAAEMTPDDFDFSSTRGENSASWTAGRAQGDGPAMGRRRQRLGRGVAQGARRWPHRQSRIDDDQGRAARRAWPPLPALSRLAHRQRLRDRRARGTRDAARRRLDRFGRGRARDRRRARARLDALGGGSFPGRRDRGRARRVARRAGLGRPAGERDRRRQWRGRRLRRRHALWRCTSNGQSWSVCELGHACAAASMRAVSTTAGVGTVSECLALAKQWGFRPLALDR